MSGKNATNTIGNAEDITKWEGGLNLGGNSEVLDAFVVANAEYPVMAPYPDEEFSVAYEKWSDDRKKQTNAYEQGIANESINIKGFITETVETLLSDANGENMVYSPINVYMALGMLAELTDGESRQQILDLLGSDSIESLRQDANAIWNAHYCNDRAVTSVLASSLWLNEDISFKQETMDNIASNYYASSYHGEMGTNEFDNAFKHWLNQNTGGLLADQINELEMTSDTVLSLATTILYSANWSDKFEEEKTIEQVFHGASADVNCDFMKMTSETSYFWADKFAAVGHRLEESGNMYFILPDEGVSIDEVLADEQMMEFVYKGFLWENSKCMKVHMSIPKFDVSSQIDLEEGLKKLGVTDVFESDKADFSAMTDISGIELSDAKHGARVMIDEEGCTAVAYTAMIYCGAPMPPDEEIDFVVDRPFIFVVTSDVGLPLFVGVVNQP